MSEPGHESCVNLPLLVHAFVDGELDADATRICRQHVRACPLCAAEYAQIQELKKLLQLNPVRYAAPDRLRLRVAAFIKAGKILATEESRSDQASSSIFVRSRMQELLIRWKLSLAALSVATAASFFMVALHGNEIVEDEIVATHIRSLRGFRLVDISAAQHQALGPWLREKLDFVPPVVDLDDWGFRLAGARVDFVGGRDSAAFVYSHRAALINLFVWPSEPEPLGLSSHGGYNLIHWTQGGLKFCAVSNLDFQSLGKFQAEIAARLPRSNSG